jgi:hypothetical protein
VDEKDIRCADVCCSASISLSDDEDAVLLTILLIFSNSSGELNDLRLDLGRSLSPLSSMQIVQVAGRPSVTIKGVGP